jgi:group II intron reverse transcriptase/maturase
MSGTLSSGNSSTKLAQIAELARKHPERVFSSLHHVIDVELLREAFRRTRKDAATGVDGQNAEEYGRDLEQNLASLLTRFRKGTYYAPPVKRVHIPKGDGRTRPIGIPTFEDKVLQRAVAMVLGAIYEQDFHPGSYGFRPGRGAHDALQAVWDATMRVGGGWVLEVDIRAFFDTLDHGALRGFLDKRVSDGVIRRAIDKWLKAGVLEEGAVTRPEEGTPQGGVVSPILANVYLHEVLDVWLEREVKPRLHGDATLIRYADDFVIVFEWEADARRVMEVLPKRFGKYSLTLHPEKTKLLKFTRPRPTRRKDGDEDGPGSFDFLGLTHHWRRSQKGTMVVYRKTARSRFTRGLARIREWCRVNRHLPIAQQHRLLAAKLRGHNNYYGLIGNHEALVRFAEEVRRAWHKWLARRSQRANSRWDYFQRILRRYPLPSPRVRRQSVQLKLSEPLG